jgi:uncharacterized membrane protein YfcA
MDFNLMFAVLLAFIITPFIGALLTFYTGFGLNTILVPVFMIYWDAPLAVFMASIVHLCNNLLKVGLTAKSIDWRLFKNFGIPAISFAFLGALLLNLFQPKSSMNLNSIFGAIFILFAVLELFNWQLPLKGRWSMRIGGVLSGFFGGFSGHQGALRAMFLSKLRIDPLVFVATTALISLMVDLTRVGVYFSGAWTTRYFPDLIIFLVVPAALSGTLVGRKYIQKVNHALLSKVIGFALFLMGIGLIFGGI